MKWHLSEYNLSSKITEENSWVIVNIYKGTVTRMNAALLYAMANLSELPEDTPVLEKLAKQGLIVDHDERSALESMARLACAYPQGIGLTICPTMGCNFDCPYCFEDHRPEMMSEKTQDDVIALTEKMLDLSGAKRLSVSWFGGEPLLAADIIRSLSERLLDLCEKRDIKYNAGIVTNGYLLDQETVDMLEAAKVSTAQITLDGIGKAHDATRHLAGGGPTFDRITDNLRNVKIPFRVNIRHNVHRENVEEQKALEKYVKELAETSGNNLSYYASPVSDNAVAHERGSNVNTLCTEDCSDVGIKRDVARLAPAMGHYCGAHTLWGVGIDAKGRLHKCWETVDKPERSFGNAAEWDPQNPIATASDPDNLTSFLNSAGALDDAECRVCKWLPLCRGGCPNARLIRTRNCVPYKDDTDAFVAAVYKAAKERVKAKK